MNFFSKDITFKEIIISYLPPILWASVIFIFSSQTTLPGFTESAYDFALKKFAHIFVYLVLYLLVFRAVHKTVKSEHTKIILFLPIVICAIYATSDEFHQSLVPGRYATLRDIAYDMLGVFIAFLKKFGYI